MYGLTPLIFELHSGQSPDPEPRHSKMHSAHIKSWLHGRRITRFRVESSFSLQIQHSSHSWRESGGADGVWKSAFWIGGAEGAGSVWIIVDSFASTEKVPIMREPSSNRTEIGAMISWGSWTGLIIMRWVVPSSNVTMLFEKIVLVPKDEIDEEARS